MPSITESLKHLHQHAAGVFNDAEGCLQAFETLEKTEEGSLRALLINVSDEDKNALKSITSVNDAAFILQIVDHECELVTDGIPFYLLVNPEGQIRVYLPELKPFFIDSAPVVPTDEEPVDLSNQPIRETSKPVEKKMSFVEIKDWFDAEQRTELQRAVASALHLNEDFQVPTFELENHTTVTPENHAIENLSQLEEAWSAVETQTCEDVWLEVTSETVVEATNSSENQSLNSQEVEQTEDSHSEVLASLISKLDDENRSASDDTLFADVMNNQSHSQETTTTTSTVSTASSNADRMSDRSQATAARRLATISRHFRLFGSLDPTTDQQIPANTLTNPNSCM